MHVLDQVYFSPVLQRKFKALARLKRRRHKMGKVANSKRQSGGGVAAPVSPGSNTADKSAASNEVRERAQITTKASAKQLAESESSDSISSQSSTNSRTDISNDSKHCIKPTAAPPTRKRKQKKKVMPIEKGKTKTLNRKMRIDRNLRLWLANRRIFIFRRKKVSIGICTQSHIHNLFSEFVFFRSNK